MCSVTQSCLTLCGPVDCSPPAPLSMGFPRQEYWSGVPFPAPRDLPDPGIEPVSLASPALAGGLSITCTTWEAPAFKIITLEINTFYYQMFRTALGSYQTWFQNYLEDKPKKLSLSTSLGTSLKYDFRAVLGGYMLQHLRRAKGCGQIQVYNMVHGLKYHLILKWARFYHGTEYHIHTNVLRRKSEILK